MIWNSLQTPRPSITMPGTNSNKSAYYDSDTPGAGLGGSQDQKIGAGQDQSKKGATASKDGAKQGNANQG